MPDDAPISGLDGSKYTQVPDVAELAQAKADNNWQFAIWGTQDLVICEGQILASLAAGFTPQQIELYVYMYWDGGNGARIANAIALAQKYSLEIIWLDCEDETAWQSAPEQISAGWSQLIAANFPPTLYTNARFWHELLGDAAPQPPAGLLFWIASWLASRVPTADDFNGWGTTWPSYGNLPQPVMWQYRGTTQVNTLTVDLDVARYVPGDVPAPAPDPAPPAPDVILPTLRVEGESVIISSDGVDVFILGGEGFPGRIAKLFGAEYWYLRKGAGDPASAYWTRNAGD